MKRAAISVPKKSSPNKKNRVLSADIQWCFDNKDDLTLASFVEKYGIINKQYALSRYGSLISKAIFGDDSERLTSELTTWRHTEEYKKFWIDRINKKTQLDVQEGCTQYVSDSAQDALGILTSMSRNEPTDKPVLSSEESISPSSSSTDSEPSSSNSTLPSSCTSPTVNSGNKSPSSLSPVNPAPSTSSTINSDDRSDSTVNNDNRSTPPLSPINSAQNTNIQDVENSPVLAPWLFEEADIALLFTKFKQAVAQTSTDHLFLIESSIHELLSLSNILLLAPEQYSQLVIDIFTEEILYDLDSYLLKDMASSAINTKNSEGGLENSKPPSNVQHGTDGKHNGKKKFISYAAAVAGERRSLLPTDPVPRSLIKEGRTIIRTQIWKHGYSDGSVHFDLRSQGITRGEFLLLVKEQYPTVVGVKPDFEGSRKFAELNFAPGDDNLKKCLETGIEFPKTESVILPSKALTGAMEVVTLKLSELPFEKDEVLLEGLTKSLEPYGEVLDVGTLVDPATQLYLCQGYATLNIKARDNQRAFELLTHLLPWFGSNTVSFRAVWNSMKPYCKYCHQDGHIIHDCPIRIKKFGCWGCMEFGHQQSKCPKLSKKRKTTVALNRTSSKDTVPPVTVTTKTNNNNPDKNTNSFSSQSSLGGQANKPQKANQNQQNTPTQQDQQDQHIKTSVPTSTLVDSFRASEGPLSELTEAEIEVLSAWYEKGRVNDDNDMELDSGRIHALKQLYKSKYADLNALFTSHNTHPHKDEEVLEEASY